MGHFECRLNWLFWRSKKFYKLSKLGEGGGLSFGTPSLRPSFAPLSKPMLMWTNISQGFGFLAVSQHVGNQFFYLQSFLSKSLYTIHLGPFQGSLTNLGASGRLQSQIQAILGQILTFPDPPCQLGQLKWSEMACTGVPQIVLHISYSTRTYWGHFRPCKVSFSALAERSSLLLRQCEFWKYCF